MAPSVRMGQSALQAMAEVPDVLKSPALSVIELVPFFFCRHGGRDGKGSSEEGV